MVSDDPESFADLDGHCGQVILPGAPPAECDTATGPGLVGEAASPATTGIAAQSSSQATQQNAQAVSSQNVLDGNLHVQHNADGTTTSYQGTETKEQSKDASGNLTGTTTASTVTTQTLDDHGKIVDTRTTTSTQNYDANGKLVSTSTKVESVAANSDLAQSMRGGALRLWDTKFSDWVPLKPAAKALLDRFGVSVHDVWDGVRAISMGARDFAEMCNRGQYCGH